VQGKQIHKRRYQAQAPQRGREVGQITEHNSAQQAAVGVKTLSQAQDEDPSGFTLGTGLRRGDIDTGKVSDFDFERSYFKTISTISGRASDPVHLGSHQRNECSMIDRFFSNFLRVIAPPVGSSEIQ